MGCGRQPGGALEAEFGPCPVGLAFDLDGLNHGHNGGRICWCVAGTLCDQNPRGTLVRADLACHECRFFRRVQDEEGSLDFVITVARCRTATQEGRREFLVFSYEF